MAREAPHTQHPPVRLRADAQRNRERLLAAARDAFTAAGGAPPSLEAIARTAGVGIGTLYRHFATREALVEAVYRGELERVSASAVRLLATMAPDRALRTWMDHYAAFVRTKHGMAEALAAAPSEHAARSGTRERINGAVGALLDAGAADGVLRADVPADDVTSSLLGICLATAATGREDQIGRMLDLLLDGLRPRTPS